MNSNPDCSVQIARPAVLRAVSVWQVVELVEEGAAYREQHVYVLATSALEAAEIVGEEELRQIVSVSQLCPISQLPTDKYRAKPVASTI